MSVGSDLRTILLNTGLSVTKNKYSGTDTTYITFNYVTRPAFWGDNEALEEQYLLQVHLVAPANTDITSYETQIKTLLSEAGYPYPSTSDATDDPATEQHIVFETEDVIGIGAD